MIYHSWKKAKLLSESDEKLCAFFVIGHYYHVAFSFFFIFYESKKSSK